MTAQPRVFYHPSLNLAVEERLVMPSRAMERFHLELKTPTGVLSAEVEVSTGFVPLASIVPLVQRLGTEAHALDENDVVRAGGRISCQQGCAACCRMLVPVSPLEAIALRRHLLALPDERRRQFLDNIDEAKGRLEQAGLLRPLLDVADSAAPPLRRGAGALESELLRTSDAVPVS